MRQLLLAVMCLMLVGCASTTHSNVFSKGKSDANMWTPGYTIEQVYECLDNEGMPVAVVETDAGDHCPARAVLIGEVSGLQPGFGPAMVGSVVQAGVILGGAAILADGIRDSGDTVNQTGGGATQNQKQGQIQGQRQSQYSKQYNKGYRRGY